ncbi:hypothetical protein FRC09_002125 [Ceratobasidium sp. 395]|nr:hypothetical protein FRC09_002125 [Ceratobasidium sp. 395]
MSPTEHQQPSLPNTTSSGETVSPDALAQHRLFLQNVVQPALISSSPDKPAGTVKGLKLRKIDREEWQLQGTIPLLELPVWFEKQMNDYTVKEYVDRPSIRLEGVDLAADDTRDLRARHFWAKQGKDISDSVWSQLVQQDAPLFRAQYDCARACQRVPESVEMPEATAEGDEESMPTSSPEPAPSKKKKAKSKSKSGKCSVQLHVEISAGDLSVAKIWQKGGHKDADPRMLQWSRRLHLGAVILSRREGATAGQIRKSLTARLQDNTSPDPVPKHRHPKKSDIDNIMPAARQYQHYAKNAFAALDLYAKTHANQVFLYQAFHAGDTKQAASKLMCGMTNEFALSSALLHAAQRGIFMDATWRGMNHNYAPVTFLLGVDENLHATPFAVLLSQDVQATSLTQLLTSWMTCLRAHSRRILAGLKPHNRTETEIAVIEASAMALLDSQWTPAFVMIDKDNAERNASKKAFPQTESGNTGKTKKKAPAKKKMVPAEAHSSILKAFRFTQRCRSAAEFPLAQAAFESAIQRICDEYEIDDMCSLICGYFSENFWSPLWRDCVTDIGLPAGAVRDGILNTNNYAESIIKTFKSQFLGMRKNKRIDTLVIIICDVFFPYYEQWKDDRIRHAKSYVATTESGYNIWCNGQVKRSKIGNGFDVDLLNPEAKNKRYLVTWPSTPSCSCSAYGQTGKMCSHMWAARLFHDNGAFVEWTESTVARLGDKALKLDQLTSDRGIELDQDRTEINDLFHSQVQSWISNGVQLAQQPGFVGHSTQVTGQEELPTQLSQPHPSSIHKALEPANHQFTPIIQDTGGRRQSQSPIRPGPRKRTYSVLRSHVATGHTSPAPKTSPIAVQKKRGRIMSPTEQLPPVTQASLEPHRAPQMVPAMNTNKAAELDDEEALFLAGIDHLLSNFSTWTDPNYQLVLDEAEIIAEMLGQISTTLGFQTVVFAVSSLSEEPMMRKLDLNACRSHTDVLVGILEYLIVID